LNGNGSRKHQEGLIQMQKGSISQRRSQSHGIDCANIIKAQLIHHLCLSTIYFVE
jgi:hypothetical protein